MPAKKHVLIIDDDKFLLEMYSLKFEENGFTVTIAQSGEEALTKLREGLTPDVMLLDIVMPGVDGFDILGTIQSEKLAPNMFKIVLSNQGQDPEISRARDLGADDYIVKASAIPTEVLDKVNVHLGKQTS